MHHHRLASGAPSPPIIGSRSARSGGGRGGRSRSRSSRSRSRSPATRGAGGRYRGERERDRDRDRERDRSDRRRSRSLSPYPNRNERDRRGGPSSSTKASASSDSLPSISLIQSDAPLPPIIRRILNPEEVKIPRRVNEGSKPMFERDELTEAMRRRIANDDNEENPQATNVYIQEPGLAQQRVVAIIREPVGANYPTFSSILNGMMPVSSSANPGGRGRIRRITPDRLPPTRFNRRSPSPPPKDVRSRHVVSPPLQVSSRGRSRSIERERERLLLERDRDRDRQRLIVEREPLRGPPATPQRERERDLRDMEIGRPNSSNRGGDHRRLGGGDMERDREKSRFGPGPGSGPAPSLNHRRSRSPVSRVLRQQDVRPRRRSRSHSVTPPPMPQDIRRQIMADRQRNVDLRSSLSRQPAGKFGPDDRTKGRPIAGSNTYRGSGRGGRGGGHFSARPGRGREEERRMWVHDMYEEDEPKKLN